MIRSFCRMISEIALILEMYQDKAYFNLWILELLIAISLPVYAVQKLSSYIYVSLLSLSLVFGVSSMMFVSSQQL